MLERVELNLVLLNIILVVMVILDLHQHLMGQLLPVEDMVLAQEMVVDQEDLVVDLRTLMRQLLREMFLQLLHQVAQFRDILLVLVLHLILVVGVAAPAALEITELVEPL
jgi:hypothetical protein